MRPALPAKRYPAQEPEYPAFDETLTTGLEDTVRNLEVLRDDEPPRSGNAEWQHYQLQAFRDLTEEAKKLRTEVARLHEKLAAKASKSQMEEFQKSLTESMNKRVDRLWKFGVVPTFATLAWVLERVLSK